MKTPIISRRQFIKSVGALIVSFNLFPACTALGQSSVGPGIDGGPTQLDSWLAVAPDGTITVFSGKVDLGTGVETALAQIVAEELDVPFNKIHMIGLDTTKAIDQGITAGSRTIERGGPQLRQAAAAARQELLKLAAARLNAAPEKLMVKDGVVTVAGHSKKTSSHCQSIPGLVKGVQEGSFVGVVCATEWAAIKAAKALKVTWSEPATKMPAPTRLPLVLYLPKKYQEPARQSHRQQRQSGSGARASEQNL